MNRGANMGLLAAGLAAVAAAAFMLSKRKKNGNTQNDTDMNTNNSNLPRGYRNNNPLNIRYSTSNTWLGKVVPNTDGSFEQFTSMQYGYRAALYLIRKYIAAGNSTIAGIISKWAPATENNTQRYIQRVCNTTGYASDTVINAYNKEQMCRLVYAMAIVENGNVSGHPDMNTIYQAYNLL